MSAERSFWSLFEEPKKEASTDASASRLFGSSRNGAEGEDEPHNCALEFDEDYVFWAMRDLPIRQALTHLLITGASGSGKTTVIKLFLQSIAARFRPGWSRTKKAEDEEDPQSEQLILFDAKGDTVFLLHKLGLTLANQKLFILNPYDARSAVWNLAEVMTTPAMARALATLLIPEEKHTTAPYYYNAARELVYDVILALNAILLKALTHEVLRRPDTLFPRCWFVLDEFRAMEKVDCIHELLNRGRSKGASVLLGIQSVEGIVDVYGDNAANDIFSQCANKMFLRAGGPTTARWAESFFSTVRQIETTVSKTTGGGHKTQSVQSALHERSLLLASYFLDLPFPGPGQPFEAVCDVPSLRETLVVQRQFDQLLAWCRKTGEEDEGKGSKRKEDESLDLQPCDDPKDQHLLPWTEQEELKFCGPPQTAKKPPNTTSGKATGGSHEHSGPVPRHDIADSHPFD